MPLYCEKKGFAGRFHLESECRTKAYDNSKSQTSTQNKFNVNKNNNNVKKVMNSTEMEELLTEIQSKN